MRYEHRKGRRIVSLDSGHDDPGATETAAVLPFTDGIEVSINALMTVQSDYVLLYFLYAIRQFPFVPWLGLL